MMRFPHVLAAIFITLKLIDVIDWSWLWVLSPLWFYACLLFLADMGEQKK